MKAFITGLTGFVGKHLARLLHENKIEVFGTSYPEIPSCGEKNIFYIDIRKEKKLADLIKNIQPDMVFHLAAISNVKISWQQRKQTMETNVLGTFNLLEAVRKYSPLSRILLVGSSDIYGNYAKKGELLKEEFESNPINPYAVSKICQEKLGSFYAGVENIWIVMTRSFNHTGPGQSPSFVCSDWAKQIAEIEKGKKKSILKVGNLDCERDFTDVRDIVRAYLLLLSKGKKGEVYNVCSGRTYSLHKILEILLSYSKVRIEVKVDSQKLRKTDFPFLVGDNSKLISHTGWSVKIPIEKTLLDLLNYWREKV